jgi:hypothetical protein
MYEPVIVVGPGRCGTSTVARWLHENGVTMGERFRQDRNRGVEPGYWEDLDFHELNKLYAHKELTTYQFKAKLELLIQRRKTALKPWGFKDPMIAEEGLLRYYAQYFPNALWVRCHRNHADIERSWRESFGAGNGYIQRVVEQREANLTARLSEGNVLDVSFEDIVNGNAKAVVLDAASALAAQGTDRKPRIMISVPNLGWIHYSVVQSLLKIRYDSRVNASLALSTWRPYEHNLHKTIKQLLESEKHYDYWLNIDADNAPKHNPLDLIWLNKDVIGLPTPIWFDKQKSTPLHLNAMTKLPDQDAFIPYTLYDEGIQEVDATGSGCILVARRVLEAIRAPFMRRWNDDGIVELGCDYAFSLRVTQAGFKLWSHFGYGCDHYKELELVSAFNAAHRVMHPDGEDYSGPPIQAEEDDQMAGARPQLVGADH